MPVTGLNNTNTTRALADAKAHSAVAGDKIAQISSGRTDTKASENSAAAAIAAQFGSEAKVLTQSKVNAANGINMLQVITGAQSDQRAIFTELKTLAVQSASGDLKDSTRLLVNKDFKEKLAKADEIGQKLNWNGLKLGNGGGSVGTVAVGAAVAQSASGLTAPAGGEFTNALGANTRGFISGSVDDGSVWVKQTGASTFNAGFSVSGQKFEVRGFTPTNAATVLFTSTSDSGNMIELTQGANAAANMTTETNTKAAINTTLGLVAGAQRAQFVSLATAANGGVVSVTSNSSAEAGDYALTYQANSGKFKITGGPDNRAYYTDTIAAAPAAGSPATYSFGNGLSVTINNTFALGTAVTQMMLQVDKGGKVDISYQLGGSANDVLNVQVNDMTNVGRRIENLHVADVEGAKTAMAELTRVIDDLSAEYSTIGSKQGGLETTIKSLETTTQNLLSAKSNYSDTDIAKALTEFVMANTMAQVANVGVSKSLEQTQQILSLAQKV